MPNYAKFLKDMVSRKKQIEEFETTAATETCLALMHNKVPAKKADPRSFTIECSIGHNYSTKALCDPGASINLMPKSVFQKLGIGEAKPTTMMLQLADYSFVQPEGKIEDILVRIDKFIFPVDFLILDCEADENAPIILGRHFLPTGRVLLDFGNDELVLRVDDQQILEQCHSAPYGGHFGGKRTTTKVLQSGLYWPTLHKDAQAFYQQCDRCQRTESISRRNEMPLQNILEVELFDVWGIDFMRPFPSSFGNLYILLVVDYESKSVEAAATTHNDAKTVQKFIKKNISTCLGTPRAIINDEGRHIDNCSIAAALSKLGITHKLSTAYHP
ncbi:hypothetical protein GQ457_14G014470 [Hibiscus cannabinus]